MKYSHDSEPIGHTLGSENVEVPWDCHQLEEQRSEFDAYVLSIKKIFTNSSFILNERLVSAVSLIWQWRCFSVG